MKTAQELRDLLNRIDRRGYPAYKDTKGTYQFPGYVLSIDHVQGDPFASPSKVSVHIPGKAAGFPSRLYDRPWKRIALCDALLRLFSRQVDDFSFKAKGSGKSGLISVSRCGQEILERSACQMDPSKGNIILRLDIGFPANGRTINSGELIKILYDFIPVCVKKTLLYPSLDPVKMDQIMELSQDQHTIREQLDSLGLCAFIANGAILPRESGISQRPMKQAIPFKSPASMEITLNLPYAGAITGMGIPKGVTLIVGGGYHGKSTLLEALERGVYDHIAGDGREYVITDSSAMKIRAEDGRSVRQVDISMFINDLPNKKDTKHFNTEDASGSTSQAANVVEAMESGSRLLLIDEDTSASNFMVRDALMESVVSRSCEPITPLIHRIRQLYEDWGISTILVAGSSGAFFEKADHIIQMDRYIPVEITDLAKEKARIYLEHTGLKNAENDEKAPLPDFHRCPGKPSGSRETSLRPSHSRGMTYAKGTAHSNSSGRDERVKIRVNGRDGVSLNKETIDLRYVEQLADSEQLMTLGYLLNYAIKHLANGKRTITEIIDELEKLLKEKGLAAICEGSYLPAGLAMPRRQEIFACVNRYRRL